MVVADSVNEVTTESVAKIIERRSEGGFVSLLRDADQEFQEHGFELALVDVLRREPVLVSAWATYTADQRWTPAAYIDGTTAGWYDSGYRQVRTHQDEAGAVADFIRRTAAWVARREVLLFDTQ